MGSFDLVEQRRKIPEKAKFAIVPLSQYYIKNGVNAKILI